MADKKTSSEVSSKKVSELKPLKRVKQILNTSASCKLKDSAIVGQKRGSSSHKEDHRINESSTSKTNTQTGRKGIHERRSSGEGSSHGHHSNVSPGGPGGVKDVANVVVKYLSPHLKQGSIVSKVTVYIVLKPFSVLSA